MKSLKNLKQYTSLLLQLEKDAALHIVNTFRIEIRNAWARGDASRVLHVFFVIQLTCVKIYLLFFSNVYFLLINNKLANSLSYIMIPLAFGLIDRGFVVLGMLYFLLIAESAVFYFILKSVPELQAWLNRNLTPNFVQFFCGNTSFFKGSRLALRLGIYYAARTGDMFVTNQAVSDLATKEAKFLEDNGEKLSMEHRQKIWEAAQKEVGRGFIRNIENAAISAGSEGLKGLGEVTKKVGEIISKK